MPTLNPDSGQVVTDLADTSVFNAHSWRYAVDTLSFSTGLQARHNPDWLLWRGGNLLGTFRSDMLFLTAGMTWLIDHRQELRVRPEAIGLDAQTRQAYRVAVDGEPVAVAVAEVIPDFALRKLGFQVRYRYELAPLSYLCVAYSLNPIQPCSPNLITLPLSAQGQNIVRNTGNWPARVAGAASDAVVGKRIRSMFSTDLERHRIDSDKCRNAVCDAFQKSRVVGRRPVFKAYACGGESWPANILIAANFPVKPIARWLLRPTVKRS